MSWQDDIVAAGLPNPQTTGVEAAQSAGAVPVATPKAPIIPPPPAPPSTTPPPMPVSASSDEEPSWADDIKPAPGRATMSQPDFGVKEAQASAQDAAAKAQKQSAVDTAAGGHVDTQSNDLPFGTRFDLNLSPNSPERVKKLIADGYEAKTIQMPGSGPMTIWRKPGDDAWKVVDGANWAPGDAAAVVSPQVLTQVGLTAATGGESLLARLFAQGAGGALERFGERSVDRLRGDNTGPISADLGEAGKTGLTNTGAELAGSVVSKLAKTVTGDAKGLMKGSPTAQAALQAQNDLGIDNATAGLTSGQLHPAFGMREAQIAALSDRVGQRYDAQKSALADILSNHVAQTIGAGNTPQITDAALGPTVEKAKALLDASAPNSGVEMSQGGKALQQDLQENLRPALSDKVNGRYNAALDPSLNGVYDLSKPSSIADEIAKGIAAQGKPIVKEEEVPIADGGYGLSGTKTISTEQPSVVRVGGLSPELKGPVGDLQKLNPTLGTEATTNTSAAEPLQSIRSRLAYSASEYPVNGTPEAKAAYVQANKILPALDESIANPVAGDPLLADKIQAARNAAGFKSKVLDSDVMQDVKNSTSPEDLIPKYAAPGNFSNTQLLKRTIGPDAFSTAQDALKTKLARDAAVDPTSVQKYIDSFADDPRTLNMWLPPAAQKDALDYAKNVSDFKNSLPTKLLTDQTDTAARMGQLLDSGQSKQIADMITKAGGPDSELGQNIRAGVMQKLLDDSMDDKLGKLNVATLAKKIGDMKASGDLKGVLLPGEIDKLSKMQTLANQYSKGTGNMGASLSAASHVSDLSFFSLLTSPVRSLEQVGKLGENAILARTLTSPTTRKFFIGSGSPPSAPVRQAANMLGALANQYRTSEPRQKPDQQGGNSE